MPARLPSYFRMRVTPVLLLVLALHNVLGVVDVGELVERAKREVTMERLSSGSTPARRKRKATEFSRTMEVRNAVVRRAFDELSEVMQ